MTAGEREIYCDLDAMTELACQLRTIHTNLANVSEHVDVFDQRLGSGRLEEEVDGFVAGWRDGRKEIRDGVETMAHNVERAVETYECLEQQQVSAARGEPAP